ncbi:hypothetical protein MUJ63_00965 [Lachnospiraceae bacterium NSJ-143]|nr:hypothetical protein [Lachnospiraceae bacterium NSJ-143]
MPKELTIKDIKDAKKIAKLFEKLTEAEKEIASTYISALSDKEAADSKLMKIDAGTAGRGIDI